MTYDDYVQQGGDPAGGPNDPGGGWFQQNAPIVSYQILGFDSQNKTVYQGSDGQLYTDDPSGPNGMGAYTGDYGKTTEALAPTPPAQGGTPVEGGAYTPSQGNDPGTWTTPDTPPPATTGGGSSGGGGGGAAAGAPPGTGWQAPAGPPASGFGSEVGTYTPPVYASNPNAPQFTPLPEYKAPTWTGGDFVNPTMAEVQAGPGYQSRLDQLIKARERQSAAQGTILSGGTLRALDRAGQDYATNEYQTYRTNALENYKQRYGQFTDAAGRDLTSRIQNAGEQNTAFQNQTATYNTGNARTLSDYITNVSGQRTAALDAASAKRNAETDYWSRLQDLNSTGSQLAGGSYRV